MSAVRVRFPIPLSIRACGFPAHGLPMIFCAWLRSLRVADGAAKPVQAVPCVSSSDLAPPIGTDFGPHPFQLACLRGVVDLLVRRR